jgi:DNA-binding MarR family transcriptional regulator
MSAPMATAAEPPATNPSDRGPCDRERAAGDLVQALMGVKGWFRESNRWAYPRFSNASLVALALVERSGQARVSELAEAARVDVSVVSRQVQQLEQSGLVVREADPHDRRAHLVSISDKGREVLVDGRARLESVVLERLSGWDPEELTAFATTLRSLLQDLGG